MKYKARNILDGSLQEVLAIAMDRSRDHEKYPNISSCRETRREEKGELIHCEYLLCGNGDIPEPLRPIALPHLLTWREIGCWDTSNNCYSYKLKPLHFSHLVNAWGTIKLIGGEDGKVVRELEGEINIALPVLGNLAARTIIGYMLGNYEKEAKEFDRYLHAHRQGRGS